MKKLISGLMVGIIASTCAMTTMAAPSFDHRAPHKPHQMANKPMPPKAGVHHKKMDKHFAKKDHRDFKKFDQRDHGMKGKFDHKAPPMPSKHR